MTRKRAEQRSRANERDSDGYGGMTQRERQSWVKQQVREGVRAAESRANWSRAKYENLWKNVHLQNAQFEKAKLEREVTEIRRRFEREQDAKQQRAYQEKIAELGAVIARLEDVVARHNLPNPALAAPPPSSPRPMNPVMSPDDPRRPPSPLPPPASHLS